MKLNSNQTKALAKRIQDRLLLESPKRQLPKKDEEFMARRIDRINKLVSQKNKIDEEISVLKKMLVAKFKDDYKITYCHQIDDNLISRIKLYLQDSYIKPVPSLSTIIDDIHIGTIDGDIRDIDSFIQKMVKRYI